MSEQVDHQLAEGNRLAHRAAKAGLKWQEALDGWAKSQLPRDPNRARQRWVEAEKSLISALDAYRESVGRASLGSQREAG